MTRRVSQHPTIRTNPGTSRKVSKEGRPKQGGSVPILITIRGPRLHLFRGERKALIITTLFLAISRGTNHWHLLEYPMGLRVHLHLRNWIQIKRSLTGFLFAAYWTDVLGVLMGVASFIWRQCNCCGTVEYMTPENHPKSTLPFFVVSWVREEACNHVWNEMHCH